MGYILSVVVGAVVTAVMVNILKTLTRKHKTRDDGKKDDLDLDFEIR